MKMKITWCMVALVVLQVVVMLPGSMGAPIAPVTEQPQCSDQVSCSTCSSQPGCGWCAYLFECLPGTVNGSTSGSCTDSWTLWYFEPHSCPAESPFPSLCTSKPCSECVTAGYCGWCGSSCIPGTANSPYYGSCPVWYFSHCAIVTARNVWWLWAMFAFLLLSILVSVRILHLMLKMGVFHRTSFYALLNVTSL